MKKTAIEFIFEWNRALTIEMQHLKEHGGNPYKLTNGQLMGTANEGYIYYFKTTDDIFIPDGTPVRLFNKDNDVKCEIVTIDSTKIYFKVPINIGTTIENINLISETWELLESLISRLEEIKEVNYKTDRIGKLMTGNVPVKHTRTPLKSKLHEVLLRAHYNNVTYIWGPPGTGKTYTLSKIVSSYFRKKKKVLLLSHSNAAVDVLMLEVLRNIKQQKLEHIAKIIRFGYSRNNDIQANISTKIVEAEYPDLAQRRKALEFERKSILVNNSTSTRLTNIEQEFSKLNKEYKDLEIDILESAIVIGSTLSKATTERMLYEKEYDLIVVDEISMAYTPSIAFAASLGKKVVVCGDFKQLAPIAMSDHGYVNDWLREDLFDQTGISQLINKDQIHPHLFILTKQRRMHPAISAFTNKFIYHDNVSDHPSVKIRNELSDMKPFAKNALALLDVSLLDTYTLKDSATNSRFNLVTALISISLLLRARKSGITSLGFVTPYKGQAKLMNSLIQDIVPDENIQAATVHKFQGSECDTIIFDIVDGNSQVRPGVFLTDKKSDRLVNVAMTRARGKLLVLGDKPYLANKIPRERALNKLIAYLSDTNQIYQYKQFLPELVQNKKLIWFKKDDNMQLISDLKAAKANVLVSIPFASKVPSEIWEILKQKKVKITILTREPDFVPLRNVEIIPSHFPLLFVILDEKVLWLTIQNRDEKKSLFSARLHAPNAIKLLVSYFDFSPDNNLLSENKEKLFKAKKVNYSLAKFLNVWERCPDCNSTREPEETINGKVRLICHHCGNIGGITKNILTKYIEYVDLSCKSCNQELNAVSDKGTVYAICDSCESKVVPSTLL